MDTHQVLARVIRLVPDDLSNLPSTFDRAVATRLPVRLETRMGRVKVIRKACPWIPLLVALRAAAVADNLGRVKFAA